MDNHEAKQQHPSELKPPRVLSSRQVVTSIPTAPHTPSAAVQESFEQLRLCLQDTPDRAWSVLRTIEGQVAASCDYVDYRAELPRAWIDAIAHQLSRSTTPAAPDTVHPLSIEKTHRPKLARAARVWNIDINVLLVYLGNHHGRRWYDALRKLADAQTDWSQAFILLRSYANLRRSPDSQPQPTAPGETVLLHRQGVRVHEAGIILSDISAATRHLEASPVAQPSATPASSMGREDTADSPSRLPGSTAVDANTRSPRNLEPRNKSPLDIPERLDHEATLVDGMSDDDEEKDGDCGSGNDKDDGPAGTSTPRMSSPTPPIEPSIPLIRPSPPLLKPSGPAKTLINKSVTAKRKANMVADGLDLGSPRKSRRMEPEPQDEKQEPGPVRTEITDATHWLCDNELTPIIKDLAVLCSAQTYTVDSLVASNPDRYATNSADLSPRLSGQISAARILFLPLHIQDHWVLVVVRRSPLSSIYAVDLYNSMSSVRYTNRVKELLCSFLTAFLPTELHAMEEAFHEISVAQQKNSFDCGVATFACAAYTVAQLPLPTRMPARVWRPIIRHFVDEGFSISEHLGRVMSAAIGPPPRDEEDTSSTTPKAAGLHFAQRALATQQANLEYYRSAVSKAQALLNDIASVSQVLGCIVGNANSEDLLLAENQLARVQKVAADIEKARVSFRERVNILKKDRDGLECVCRHLKEMQSAMKGIYE